MSSAPPTVTLLTDFGSRDGYVGAVKGAVLSACPHARLVDLSHDVGAGDVAHAARLLGQSAPWFPPGTVHLIVVDPGVGTERRALAAELDGHSYVAPDNGVLSVVLGAAKRCRAHGLARPEHWHSQPSDVFHGRDVFGPVAGRLAGGLALEELGPALDPRGLVRLTPTRARAQGDTHRGEVVWVDHFGNLITNLSLPAGPEPSEIEIEIDGRQLGLSRTYGDAAIGELVALVGSTGRVEIACNGGRADALLGAATGRVVVLRASRGGS